MNKVNHILVPTDFEAPSSHALELAVGLARAFEADLTLLHVWEMPVYPHVGAMLEVGHLAARREQAALQQLRTVLRQVQDVLPRAKSALRKGVPWREIVASASQLGADLVVMGTHGRHALSHTLLRSMADRVVRASPVQVLTTHEPAKSWRDGLLAGAQ